MTKENDYISLMNKSIRGLFKDALHITFTDLPKAFFLLKTLHWQKKSVKVRTGWEELGTHVPPFMILSITNRCNLRCKGCYNQAQHRPTATEMTEERVRGLFDEARELGISIILLAGGEPLVRREIIHLTKDYPEIIFPVFTNGLLLTDDLLKEIKNQLNIVPVISLEGNATETDERRGSGVYARLQQTFSTLKRNKSFFGVSLTVTRENYPRITSPAFIRELIDEGVKLFFFVEYVPVREGTEDWVMTDEQRVALMHELDALRNQFPGLFIAFPGDEEAFGGCLAAGRGFVHVSPEGFLEPCPFAPYADTNLKEITLKEALGSEFLQKIRENHAELTETQSGCALWEKREWVQTLLHSEEHPASDKEHA